MQQRIWEPAGLLNTGYDNPTQLISQRADGYRLAEAGFQPAPNVDVSFLYGAGALYADARDLWLWNRQLRTGALLQETTRDLMFAPAFFAEDVSHGFGWQFDTFLGEVRERIEGSTFGYGATLTHYPAADLTIVVLSNLDQISTGIISEQLAAISLDREAELPAYSDRAFDPSTFAKYVGVYEVEPELRIRVIEVAGRLFGGGEDAEFVALTPLVRDVFIIYGADFRITFIVNGEGEVTGLRLLIEGEETIAPKIE